MRAVAGSIENIVERKKIVSERKIIEKTEYNREKNGIVSGRSEMKLHEKTIDAEGVERRKLGRNLDLRQ